MLCRDIMKVIETTYSKHAALEWDNVGLLAGRKDKDVKKIYVALDATDEVIDEVIALGADMLITHHPLLFSPLKQITDEHFVGGRVVKLLQHDISYYAMHTNYDVLRMASLSGEMLGLTDMEVLEMTDSQKIEGIGRVGHLANELSLRECCELVKVKFQLDVVKVFGDLDKKVTCVAISPGSGKHMTELAIAKEADVFVTAEIDHHEGIDSVAQGMAIIDAGHYGLEHIFIKDVAEFLEAMLSNVEIVMEEKHHPFQLI